MFVNSFGVYGKKCDLKGCYSVVMWILLEFPALHLFPFLTINCGTSALQGSIRVLQADISSVYDDTFFLTVISLFLFNLLNCAAKVM